MATRPDPSKQSIPLRSGPPQAQRPNPPTTNTQNVNQDKPVGATPAKPARKYEWPSDTPPDIRSATHGAIELAIRLLKTVPSRKHLVGLGLDIITSFSGQHLCPPDMDQRKMYSLVVFFLNSIDCEFPKLEYSRIQGAAALFQPTADWCVQRSGVPKGLRDWKPLASGGTLTLGDSVFGPLAASREERAKRPQPRPHQEGGVTSALRARHDEAYTRLQFAAGTCIAAHLVTCFVGLLTGANPRYVRESRPLGHSSWAFKWERAVLGGEVTTRMERRHPLGAGQGGTVWLVDERRWATRVDEECVRAVVGYDFVLPLVTTKEESHIEELPQTMEGVRAAHMAQLVHGAARVKRPEAKRVPSGNDPSSSGPNGPSSNGPSNSASSTTSSNPPPPRSRPTQTLQGTD
ncbi:predicted protein [Chaetomium globosum CBS 148.51]|uniref:Uncharacterized protein n=1 Tax=Chaetomium globosum (strain ATCC 6205 / CBS 148.51 / DSM 1962 / NBRC 6347 / NRRL 1970) TaxID=306901 RepID=Q2HFR0_CHAGB|nr:uncharacterized protein CHGG_00944 [Chaetomium globosum CBS 148.51]EAQ92709.1 predicted protein [Chaetomium globosum CBS 148.51]